MPWYDQWGWASSTEIPGRYTDVPLPENIPQGHAANWTGYAWVVRPYVAPPVLNYSRVITKRSFWNRFPAEKEVAMRAVMMQGTPALLAGSLERLKARVESSPFVDLDLEETQLGIMWLMSQQVPEFVTIDGISVPIRLTPEEGDVVLNSPIQNHEAYKG